MQLKKYGKDCEIFAVRVEDMRDPINTTYGDDYIFEHGEMIEKLKESFEEKNPYLKNYWDVFPKKVLGLPPSWVFDFTIDLIPGVQPIS